VLLVWLVSVGILALALLDLAAIWWDRPTWRYVLKPGTMVLIILLAVSGLPEAGPYGWLLLAGLLFSIAGDILLMLPSDRFLPGLLSFFIAHLLYIAAFRGPLSLGGGSGLVALGLGVAGFSYFWLLKRGVVEQGGKGLLLPVLAYVIVISVMVWRAFGTGQPLLIAGALLFYLSDAILAGARFIRPHRLADLGVMSTYFAAQYLITLSLFG